MPTIGIRKLKNATSEVIRAVREEGVQYVVTYRGKPVATIQRIAPTEKSADEILDLAASVYQDLDLTARSEIENIAKRRADFFKAPNSDPGEPE